MYSTNQSDSSVMELKGLSSFKTFIMLFILLKVLAVGAYFLSPLLAILLYVTGTVCLILGIFMLSKQNSGRIHSGMKSLVLFVLAVLFELILAFLNFIYPHSVGALASFNAIEGKLGTVNQNFGFAVYPIATVVLMTGMFMALAAQSFSGWFSNVTNKEFNIYSYFGYIFVTAEIIIFSGYVVLVAALNEILSETHGTNTGSIAFSELIITVGVVFLLVSFLVEAFAGYKMLKIVNNKS